MLVISSSSVLNEDGSVLGNRFFVEPHSVYSFVLATLEDNKIVLRINKSEYFSFFDEPKYIYFIIKSDTNTNLTITEDFCFNRAAEFCDGFIVVCSSDTEKLFRVFLRGNFLNIFKYIDSYTMTTTNSLEGIREIEAYLLYGTKKLSIRKPGRLVEGFYKRHTC